MSAREAIARLGSGDRALRNAREARDELVRLRAEREDVQRFLEAERVRLVVAEPRPSHIVVSQ